MRLEHWLYTVPLRLRTLFRRRSADRELDDELRDHLEQKITQLVATGVSVRQARRAALIELGGMEKAKEECREMRKVNFIQNSLQDLHYALRVLRKSPGFAAVAIVTLALGIGANTAIFSVVNAVLLKPLNYKDPSSLTLVWENLPRISLWRNVVSPANFIDWQDQNHAFAGMAAFLDQPVNLTGAGQPEQVDVEFVSPNFFAILGAQPMLGRSFSPEDVEKGVVSGGQAKTGVNPSKAHIVVLSYGLWKSKFGADPNIIGKSVELNGEAITVVGVMGPDFDWYVSEFSFTHERPQLWTPLEMDATWHDRTKVGRFLRVIGRVRPGVPVTQAQAQMNVIAANLAARYPKYDKGWGVTLVPLRDEVSGAFRPALLILLGAVGLVLLIACANISSLLLSRAAGRRREIAIRVALGASRRRIAQQLLTESILLGVIGGVLGALVAVWATESLVHAASASLLDFAEVSVNWHILAFAAGATLLAGLLAGLLPSLMTARAEVASALPEGGRTSSAGRKSLAARSVFVVAEISLALVLLAGSSLLIQSFYQLMNVDTGFHVSHLLTFQISLPEKKYNDQARAAFFNQLLGKVRALPGAISASGDVTPPFSGVGAATDFAIVGEPPLPPGESHGTDVRVVEPDYFRTMGIPLLRGRTFNEREFAQQTNVVVINRVFADQYFPGKNPLGQKVIIDMKDTNLPDEIVGVVGDVHESDLATAPAPVAYWPYSEMAYSTMTVVVRTATLPLSLVPAIREALGQIDSDQPMAKISTMDQLIANSVSRSRFTMLLLSCFAGLALVLACIGIYGVIAYSVTQRTHEIGIRLALGAQRRDVLLLILRQGARLAAIGVAIGLAGALALTRLMTTLLYGVSPSDPWTFAGVSVLLTLVALLACYIPARRAMKVDPMVALRYE